MHHTLIYKSPYYGYEANFLQWLDSTFEFTLLFVVSVLLAFEGELDENGRLFWETLHANEVAYEESHCSECTRIRKERGQISVRLVAAGKLDDNVGDNRANRLCLERQHRHLGKELVEHMADSNFADNHPSAQPPFFSQLNLLDVQEDDAELVPSGSDALAGGDEGSGSPPSDIPVFSDEENPACFRGVSNPIMVTQDMPVRARTGRRAIELGDMAIIRLEEPEGGLPWAVVKVTGVHPTCLGVHWHGNRNFNPEGTFKPLWNRKSGYYASEKPSRATHTPFTGFVPCSSVIDWDFSLTQGHRLPTAVKVYLKYLPRNLWPSDDEEEEDDDEEEEDDDDEEEEEGDDDEEDDEE